MELADSLDSGSSAHYGRAGSSPPRAHTPRGRLSFAAFFCIVTGGCRGVWEPPRGKEGKAHELRHCLQQRHGEHPPCWPRPSGRRCLGRPAATLGAPDPQALSAERIYVGFWTDRGTCDAATAQFLRQLTRQEVFLFGTAGLGATALTSSGSWSGRRRTWAQRSG